MENGMKETFIQKVLARLKSLVPEWLQDETVRKEYYDNNLHDLPVTQPEKTMPNGQIDES
jgi:hypothetical protein